MCGPWLDYSPSKLEFLETCDSMDVARIVDDVVELFIFLIGAIMKLWVRVDGPYS